MTATMETGRIAILPCGTHGDHQPFVPMMQELMKLGFEVQMWVTSESYEETFGDFGVDVKCMPGLSGVIPTVEQITERDEHIRDAMASGKGLQFLKSIGGVMMEYWPKLHDATIQAFEEYRPNLVVYSPLFLGLARFLIDKYNVPACMAYFYPRCPSSEYFPLTFARPDVSLPFGLNDMAHWFANKLANKASLSSDAQEVRKRAGLPAIAMQDLWDLYESDALPQVGGWSPLVSPPCSDWNNVHVTGWWTIPEDLQVQQFKPSQELEDFISGGKEKPVYMGWGSMISGTPTQMARFATEAAMQLRDLGVRCVVLGGWAKIDPEPLFADNEELKEFVKDNMLFYAGKVPHEWLLPRCSCAVIHGGAGTTGVVLRSGIPCIITPCISDQFYWASCVEKLQVGRGFSQHMSKIQSSDLAAAISKCMANETIKRNAQDLGNRLRQENGAASAAAILAKVAKESAIGAWQNPFTEMKTVCC